MRFVTFNVLVGGEDRLDAICALLASARPDLLVLQECVGWEDGRALRAVAEAIGVPRLDRHVTLGVAHARPSGQRYNVGILSRAPLERVALHTRNLAHCVVEAHVELDGEDVVVLATHLVSTDEDARLAEVAELVRIAPPEAIAKGRYVLAGDLNALARHDPYPSDLDDRLARAGMEKYGHPTRFDVMDRLFAAGWLDALHVKPASTRWITARRERNGEVIETRTDYVLLSPVLAPKLASADVIDAGDASDHDAVTATLGA